MNFGHLKLVFCSNATQSEIMIVRAYGMSFVQMPKNNLIGILKRLLCNPTIALSIRFLSVVGIFFYLWNMIKAYYETLEFYFFALSKICNYFNYYYLKSHQQCVHTSQYLILIIRVFINKRFLAFI